MAKISLAAVVVWYNPNDIDGNPIENIQTYLSEVDRLYIVDNSPESNEELSRLLPASVYIHNKNRGGLGGGQNVGFQKALQDGFSWAMTMDQDSRFKEGVFKKYRNLVENYIEKDSSAVSFAPLSVNINERIPLSKKIRFKILSPMKKFLLGKKYRPNIIECAPKDKVIASANIVKLSAWREIGGFDERLFISEVDYDFCYRLRKANYTIIKFNTVRLIQQGGVNTDFRFSRNSARNIPIQGFITPCAMLS